MGFPFVFQMLFFGYAMLGAVVFIILDSAAQAVRWRQSCGSPYGVCMSFFRSPMLRVGPLWPQFDPEDEKGKIDKILKPKREQYEAGKVEVLIAARQSPGRKDERVDGSTAGLGAAQAPADQKAGRWRRAYSPRRPRQAAISRRWARNSGNCRNVTTATS